MGRLHLPKLEYQRTDRRRTECWRTECWRTEYRRTRKTIAARAFWVGGAVFALLACAWSSPAGAASDRKDGEETAGQTRQPTRQEIEAFLDSHSLPKGSVSDGTVAEVPPHPPRHRGVVLETSAGVEFPLGALRHVSPPSPWLQLSLGYELADWFMVVALADLSLANTSYAARPPEPRTYAHYAFGAGARFQLPLTSWLATHAQLELGVSEVTEEVLAQYGYRQADDLSLHYGARLGLEWLQVNPHMALGLQGTFRNYTGLDRSNNADAPISVIGALALRYAF